MEDRPAAPSPPRRLLLWVALVLLVAVAVGLVVLRIGNPGISAGELESRLLERLRRETLALEAADVSVPLERNAAPLYDRAASLMDTSRFQVARSLDVRVQDRSPAVSAWVEESGAALALLESAAECPEFRPQPLFVGGELDGSCTRPYAAAYLLACRARLRLERGQLPEAAADAVRTLRVTAHRFRAMLDRHSYAIEEVRWTSQTLEGLFAHPGLDAKTARFLAQSLPEPSAVLEDGGLSDRMDAYEGLSSALALVRARSMRAQTEGHHRRTAGLAAANRVPVARFLGGVLSAEEREFLADTWVRGRPDDRRGRGWGGRFLDVLPLHRVAFAVRAFTLENGVPPGDLQELVPGYLEALPAPPEGIGPFRIRVLPGGWEVVGEGTLRIFLDGRVQEVPQRVEWPVRGSEDR
jgi:hypothetical protein